MTTAFQHALRVTIRIDLGDEYAETNASTADLAIPAQSTLGDCLEDILQLIGAPIISRPWQARTAAGREIDPSIPLGNSGLTSGSLIILSPHRDRPAPVVKDAAESLLDVPTAFNPTGLAAAATAISCTGLGVLTWRSNLPTLSPPFLLGLLALTCFSLSVWLRVVTPLLADLKLDNASNGVWTILSWAFSGLAVFQLVHQQRPTTPGPQVGWAFVAAILIAGACLLALAIVAHPPLIVTASLASASLLLLVGALSLFFVHSWTAVAASTIAVALLSLTFLPTIAVALAGLDVPRLPSAGQDLRISDQAINNADTKAVRANALLDATLIGLSTVAAMSTVFLGWVGGAFSCALALCSVAAVLLHAVRHRSPRAMWGLWMWALAGLAAAVLASRTSSTPTLQICIVVFALLSGMSAPLWASRVRFLPATAVSWLERAETLAVAAAIPIAVHLVGVFAAIRGLG